MSVCMSVCPLVSKPYVQLLHEMFCTLPVGRLWPMLGPTLTAMQSFLVAAWLSGSELVSINEVTLRRACILVTLLRWVTVCGRVNHLGL